MKRLTPMQRWAAKVRLSTFSNGCWEWTAALKDGYGSYHDGVRNTTAHRYSYERFIGPIPDGLTIDHLCRNRACVNPSHLEAVTNRVNVLRGIAPPAQSARKTHCLRGHLLAGDNLRISSGRRGIARICRVCNRINKQIGRQRRVAAGRVPVHGLSGYTNSKCRCDVCRSEANAYARRKHHAKRAAETQQMLAEGQIEAVFAREDA